MFRTQLALGILLAGMAPLGAQTVLHEVTGSHADEWFGYAVAGIGDVDLDGVPDFAVSAPESFFAPTPGPGAVFVYSGRDRSLIRTLSGDQPGDTFGESLAGLGDVDGDNVPDFAAGGTQYVYASDSTGLGYVRVFSGADGSILHEFTGTSVDEAFGGTLSCAGDVDDDGTPDLLISAYWAGYKGATLVGAVHVYSGASWKLLTTLYGSGPDATFGYATDGVGDLNHDGHDDFMVGAPNDFVNNVQSGSIQVFSGADFSVMHAFGRTVHGVFGIVVSGGGDVNADGTPDFAAADTQDLSNSNEFSRVIVYSGADGTILRQFGGNQIFDGFGYGLEIGADVDGDGNDDVAIGSPGETDWTGGIPGALRAYSGLTGGLIFEEFGTIADDFIGYGLCSDALGDLNGDGMDELVVGGPYLATAASDAGLIHVVTAADLHASWQNYGAGWPGTHCIPAFTASAAPTFGASITLALDNSSGVSSFALVLGGFGKATIPTTQGGTLLVATPWIVIPAPLPAAGLAIAADFPIDVTFAGLELDLQALELDAGASHGLSFTTGLELILGG